MTTNIKYNVLDDSILVSTFEKVIKFEIKKTVFLGVGNFCHPVGTLRVKVFQNN